jgi:hypothetical protein
MLWNPQAEIYDITRALARTQRVFNIHLRNIRGRRDNFQEVWADEGDVNEARIVQILAEEGYPYSIDPDHEPQSPDDSGQMQGFAHGFGYIEALIKAVDTLSPPFETGTVTHLQVMPNQLNLRRPAGVTTVVMTVPNVNLAAWGVSEVSANGLPAVSFTFANGGSALVSTFRNADLGSVTVGSTLNLVLTVRSAKDTLVASTTVPVIR